MKIFNLITFIFAIVFLQSCNRNEEISVQKITDTEKIQTIINSGIKGIPFPEGSTAYKLANNQTKITLPEDVYFVVKNQKGEVFRVRELGVRCTCSKGSGCSPANVKGQFFCVMNEDCKTCSSSPAVIGGKDNTEVDMNQRVEIVGVMNENKELGSFGKEKGLLTITDGGIQYGITEDFFKCKEVQDYLIKTIIATHSLITKSDYKQTEKDVQMDKAYLQKHKAGIESLYNEVIYVKTNFFGNNVLFPYPKKLMEKWEDPNLITFTAREVDEDLGNSACTCQKGEGCTLRSAWVPLPGVGSIKYCDAGGCTICTLK